MSFTPGHKVGSFQKVPSVLKRLLIGIGVICFFPVTIAGIVNELRTGTLAEHHDLNGPADWIFALVGPALLVWLLDDILRPRVKAERWYPFIRTFDFLSTHPSYVLIDLLTIAFAAIYVWIGMSGDFEIAIFWIACGTAIAIPVLRITAWYVLGLKVQPHEDFEAYLPPLWSFLICAPIFLTAVFAGAVH
jgi:hypothetical protein